MTNDPLPAPTTQRLRGYWLDSPVQEHAGCACCDPCAEDVDAAGWGGARLLRAAMLVLAWILIMTAVVTTVRR